jgi:hypothetical protein
MYASTHRGIIRCRLRLRHNPQMGRVASQSASRSPFIKYMVANFFSVIKLRSEGDCDIATPEQRIIESRYENHPTYDLSVLGAVPRALENLSKLSRGEIGCPDHTTGHLSGA